MIIGVTELMWKNHQRYSNHALEELMSDTLKIEPLGEIYKEIKLLPPTAISSEYLFSKNGESTSSFIQDLREISSFGGGRGKEIRQKNKADALVAVITGDPHLEPLGWVLEYEYPGKGTVFVGSPTPSAIAHELGHLFYLDHHYEDGSRNRCIMHVGAQLLYAEEVNEFSLKNRQRIRDSVRPSNKLKFTYSRLKNMLTHRHI